MGEEQGEKKPRLLQTVRAEGSDKSCVTFVLHNEDHTLGNSLRYMIMKDPDVEFCGYSITHPSESKINFRIQTKGGISAAETFEKGLEELLGVCQHVLSKFERGKTEDPVLSNFPALMQPCQRGVRCILQWRGSHRGLLKSSVEQYKAQTDVNME